MSWINLELAQGGRIVEPGTESGELSNPTGERELATVALSNRECTG